MTNSCTLHFFKTTTICLLILSCIGCTAVSYQPNGWRGGYIDTALDDTSYRVFYSGNGSINTMQAADFAVLRSAIVTQQRGFPYVELEIEKIKTNRTYGGTPGIYIEKPNVWIKATLLKATKGNGLWQDCSRIGSLVTLPIKEVQDIHFIIDPTECVELLQNKYQLSDAQLYPKQHQGKEQ